MWKHSHRGWLLTDPIMKSNKWFIFIFIFYFYSFIYLFIYLFYGLGSNVTNPFWYDTDASYQDIFVLYSIVEPKKYQVYLLFT